QFVIGGYLVAYAVLLITGVRLGQTHGCKRPFLTGVSAFGLCSLAAGVAPDVGVLIGMRVFQGAAAALMLPQVLTGIQLHFDGERRSHTIGLHAVALSVGAVAGQILGGVLISADIAGQTWRPAFLINVPICLAALAFGINILPADDRRTRSHLDLPGVAILSIAVLCLVVPLTVGPDTGWSAWTWATLAASIPALTLFVHIERRALHRGHVPLVHVAIISRPAIGLGMIGLGSCYATYVALLFTLAQYLQTGLHHSALFSGLILVPWAAAFAPDISGLSATVTQIGGSLGVAGFGTLYLTSAHTHSPGHAFGITALALAATAILASIPTYLTIKRPTPAEPTPRQPVPASAVQEPPIAQPGLEPVSETAPWRTRSDAASSLPCARPPGPSTTWPPCSS
ncbi:MAG: MFS transporter, partial [Acidimicrobiales bacterium]